MSTTTREEVIAAEQKAVDHAYDCYTARLDEMSGTSAATASASGKDGIANRIDAQARAAAYGGLVNESLVFSRVDAPEEPGGEPRPWYIGRRGVRDAENEPVVLLWTSPLAKKWSEARPEEPGEVVLRRQLRCVQRVVEDYFDEIDEIAPAVPVPSVPVPSVPVPASVPEPRPAADDATSDDAGTTAPAAARPEPGTARRNERPAARTPGDVARRRRRKPLHADDFLLRELHRSRSGRMRDIVETIRRDQMDLVTGTPSDILVVQGGPGTGKSAVGLHRVTWLVNNEHFKAQDILVIGPHQRFLEYVGQVLPTLGTRDVNAVQLTRLWDGEILGTDTPRARYVKSDERMAAVLRRRVETECRPEALDDLTTAPSFEGDEAAVVVTAGSTTLRVPRSEVLAFLDEARGTEGAYRERRERFRSLLVDRLLQELAAVAPRRGQGGTIRRDLERNRRVERLVERIWPSPGAREALRSLYDSPDLLRTCAADVLDDDEQAALHRSRAATADADPWTLDDHVCLEELRFLITGETPRRYGHIVVDEAQDLTPMQARALRRRCAANGSMTVLGDLAQATGSHIHTSWDRLGTLLSDHGDWRVAELNTSYRVPAEIMEFVAPLARAVAPELPYPQAVREAGENAVRTMSTEPWRLLDDTVTQVTRLVGTSDGHTLRSVAVIVPDDSGWLDEIGRHLDQSAGITGPGREAVSVLAAAQAKGMEYDHVLVVEPATIADRGPAGLRQLYIALTRSTQSLTVLHTSPLPEILTNTDRATEPPLDETESGTAPGGIPEIPEIGTDIRVRVVGPGPGGRYRVKALSPGIDRPLVLTVRHGSAPPRPGEELDCWVFANETTHSVLAADQRGRRPISPRMAQRYAAALGVLDELVSGDGSVAQDARGRLSDLQGMANRILRRDQADWVAVRRLLGAPDRHRLGVLRDLAAGTNRALKDNALDAGRLQDELAKSGWADALAEARETLRVRLAAEAEPESENEATTAAHQPEQKETEPVTAVEEAPATPAVTTKDGLLRALEASATADRTCRKHESVRHALKSALLWSDLQPADSEVVDVSCVTDGGLFVYEVLTAGRSTYADLRSGATRLLEINHTLPNRADGLHLVLSGPPAEDWSAETILDVFGVHVLWRTPDGAWGGRDTESALGLGQE
ncbi:AAA family ATPase [Streptomyces sp. ISL-100]|uniref:HelD family protein n=1 Tax=Streptomyces sp. ISL-100 TaxID=2819173 RepID=UPI001BE707A5|nr:AAA family ATPase [Streptomyces sp. ISL-100]MBT2400455.1 AAA family ATPase [Streptomyces sp. ISL-100]